MRDRFAFMCDGAPNYLRSDDADPVMGALTVAECIGIGACEAERTPGHVQLLAKTHDLEAKK